MELQPLANLAQLEVIRISLRLPPVCSVHPVHSRLQLNRPVVPSVRRVLISLITDFLPAFFAVKENIKILPIRLLARFAQSVNSVRLEEPQNVSIVQLENRINLLSKVHVSIATLENIRIKPKQQNATSAFQENISLYELSQSVYCVSPVRSLRATSNWPALSAYPVDILQ